AGHSLSLDENHQKQIKLPNKTIESSLGLAINGIVSGKIGRISKLCIGENYCWEQVISSFPDTLLIAYRDEKVDKQGSIGIGILERFVLTLDYTHQRCMLKPSKKYKNNFEIGFSGIELLMQIEPKKVFIASVHPLSEAYKAGLQAGDEVLALNDKVIRNFSLGDLYDFLDKKEGRQIYLLVKRKEELIVIAFKTKKLI
ncbi:MAG: PDZ domain-containing protein, partial [Thermonemataceae bacterium]|nr:PDZ domain-containing protein [Thermonemataceae bacterium]